MKKPRIVIADDDFSYVLPLQSKFVYEFFDEVELELITDRQYFEELFSSLQKIDILVVDKKFYHENLKKHEIENIFILTEDYDDDIATEANIHALYKYTNVKGIFLEIVGAGGLKISMKKDAKEPEIVLVTSASGGIGKTTVALGIAGALSDMYKRVLYVEASRLQNFQYYLENTNPILSQDIYTRLSHAGKDIYQNIKSELRTELFTYMPPLKASLMAYGIDFSMYGKVAKSAKESGEFDYIIVDADSTFDEAKAKMMGVSDKIILVTQQTKQAAYATEVLVSNISNIETDKYLFICNRYANQRQDVFTSMDCYHYKIDEYVDDLENFEEMTCKDFAKEETIRKIAFLLI